MSQTHARTKKRRIIALASVITLAGAGAAFAYWTATGTGTGAATTGASAAFTVTSDPAVGDVTPGGPGAAVAYHVTNPADGPQTLTAVTAVAADAAGVAWVPTGACLAADYVITVDSVPAGAIPAGATVDGAITVTLTDTGANQDDCQGQTVPLYIVAS